MQNFEMGQMPRTLDKDGKRRVGEFALVAELAAILRGAITQQRRFRSTGLTVPFAWACAHMDNDEDLTRRALVAAGCSPGPDGNWFWRYQGMPLSRAADLDALGDALTSAVDFHRPV